MIYSCTVCAGEVFGVSRFAFLQDMKKSQFIALVSIIIALVVFLGIYLFTTTGPSSDNAMIKGCTEYILDQFGAVNSKSRTWSNYQGKESDLTFKDNSAIDLCNYLGKGTFNDEVEARKALLKGCTYSISKCEFYNDSAVVNVTIDSSEHGKATATVRFVKNSGTWDVDHDSVFQAVLAGNGIGGSGNVITDIFNSLHD